MSSSLGKYFLKENGHEKWNFCTQSVWKLLKTKSNTLRKMFMWNAQLSSSIFRDHSKQFSWVVLSMEDWFSEKWNGQTPFNTAKYQLGVWVGVKLSSFPSGGPVETKIFTPVKTNFYIYRIEF